MLGMFPILVAVIIILLGFFIVELVKIVSPIVRNEQSGQNLFLIAPLSQER
jgi:hypothetical protein